MTQICQKVDSNQSKTPSVKQIELAKKIADTLCLDFPTCSKQYTSQAFWEFINKNMEIFKRSSEPFYDDDFDCLCQNDLWGEHY